MSGKTILVAAHGNSLRGLIMKLEGLNREQIIGREIGTGVPILYRIGADGAVLGMEELRPA